MTMQRRVSAGQAYRTEELVCSELIVTENVEVRANRVPLPGTGGYDVKEHVIHQPTTVRFVQIDDAELRRELHQLVAGALDVDLRRRQRDAGWAVRPLEVVLEYERRLAP